MSRNEMQQKWDGIIQECDQLIKAGKFSAVANRVFKLNFSQVPREMRQSLAKICRRSGLLGQGLRLLHPIIRHEKSHLNPPTSGEICEYSVLLSRIGSTKEALQLLSKVDPQDVSEALLYQGFCHISDWDYEQAIPYLMQYLKSTADEYSKLIARVNLSAALLETSKLNEANELLEETIVLAQKAGASRLAGNCLEIWGRVSFHQNDFSQANLRLNQALEIFGSSQTYDQLFIRKTKSIMEGMQRNSTEPLLVFRQEALSRRHWESVRDIDCYINQIQFDQKTFDHLFFGTPMQAYRKRILALGTPSEVYLYGKEGPKQLDLLTGDFLGLQKLNPGKKVHNVLVAMLEDLYAPRNMGSLFSKLYPQEFFDINSSVPRIKQLLLRTRVWLKENQIAAQILHDKGHYQFSISGEFGIVLHSSLPDLDSNLVRWEELKKVFPSSRSFSADEACRKLNWSRSTFLRWAEWSFSKGLLLKSGVGKSRVYIVSTESQNEANRLIA